MVDIHDSIEALFDEARTIVMEHWPRPPQSHGLKTTDVDTATTILVGAISDGRRAAESVIKTLRAAIAQPDFRREALSFVMHYERYVRHRLEGGHYVADMNILGIHVAFQSRGSIVARGGNLALHLMPSATRPLPFMGKDGTMPAAGHVRRCLAKIDRALSIRRKEDRLRAGAIIDGEAIALDGNGPISKPHPMRGFGDGAFLVVPGENSLLQQDRSPMPLGIWIDLTMLQHRHEKEMVRQAEAAIKIIREHREWRPALLQYAPDMSDQIQRSYRGRRHLSFMDARIHAMNDFIMVELEHDEVDARTLIPRRTTKWTKPGLAPERMAIVQALLRECEQNADAIAKLKPYPAPIARWQDVDPGRHMVERVTLNMLTASGGTPADAVRKAVFGYHCADPRDALPVTTNGITATVSMDQGRLLSTIDFADGVRWVKGGLELAQTIPETMALSVRGEPLRRIVDHPWLEGLTIKSLRSVGRKTRISVVNVWAMAKGEDR